MIVSNGYLPGLVIVLIKVKVKDGRVFRNVVFGFWDSAQILEEPQDITKLLNSKAFTEVQAPETLDKSKLYFLLQIIMGESDVLTFVAQSMLADYESQSLDLSLKVREKLNFYFPNNEVDLKGYLNFIFENSRSSFGNSYDIKFADVISKFSYEANNKKLVWTIDPEVIYGIAINQIVDRDLAKTIQTKDLETAKLELLKKTYEKRVRNFVNLEEKYKVDRIDQAYKHDYETIITEWTGWDNTVFEKFNFVADLQETLEKSKITDLNIKGLLEYKIKNKMSLLFTTPNYIASEDVLVLIGEKYFNNWPAISLPDSDEVKDHKYLFILPFSDSKLGIYIDISDSQTNKHYAYKFAWAILPLKHLSVIPANSVNQNIVALYDPEAMDKRYLYNQISWLYNVTTFAYANNENKKIFDIDNIYPKQNYANITEDFGSFIFLGFFCKHTKDKYTYLEVDLQNYLLFVTLYHQLAFFKVIEDAIHLFYSDSGMPYFNIKELELRKLSEFWIPKKYKPLFSNAKPVQVDIQTKTEFDFSEKTILVSQDTNYNQNPEYFLQIASAEEATNIIVSDGNLPGKVLVLKREKLHANKYGFFEAGLGYLDFPKTTEQISDLTNKITPKNFIELSENNFLDHETLFFLLESLELENLEPISRALLSDTSQGINEEHIRDIQNYIVTMLRQPNSQDFKTNLLSYIRYIFIHHSEFKINDIISPFNFSKTKSGEIDCYYDEKKVYEIVLKNLKNRRVVELVLDKNDEDDKVLARSLTQKILTLDDMPESTKLGIIGRTKKLLASDKSSDSNSKQRDAVTQIMSIPYGRKSKDNEISEVIKKLDNAIYGLDFTKKQILQFLAKHKLNNSASPKTICLVGNPGVGKTYFCQELAKALNRPCFKIGVGGLDSAGMLSGSNPVYSGSDTGYIVKSLIQNQVMNPVIILDEIDKLAGSYSGSRSGIQSALLDIIDPIQNSKVRDNFLQIELDLSQVWFIATANTTKSITPALLDRMEVIEIPDYSLEQKTDIFDKIIWPRNIAEAGLGEYSITWTEDAKKEFIISLHESGIRTLDKKVSNLCGSLALDVVTGKLKTKKVLLNLAKIDAWEAEWQRHVDKNKIGFEIE